MLSLHKDKRGQSALEAAMLLMVIAAALIGMKKYLERAAESRLRENSNQISEQQFDYGNSNVYAHTYQYSKQSEKVDSQGTKVEDLAPQIQNQYETVSVNGGAVPNNTP
jgi:Flp pilus assembly pilin Flp